jgi:hypothetical protein
MPVINLLSILFFIFTLMYVLCIYLFHYAQCIVYFIYAIITHCFQIGRMEHPYLTLEEEYNKDHRARYIEEGQVTKILIVFTLTLIHEVCKTNKHFCMSLVGSLDPSSQDPRRGNGDGFR